MGADFGWAQSGDWRADGLSEIFGPGVGCMTCHTV